MKSLTLDNLIAITITITNIGAAILDYVIPVICRQVNHSIFYVTYLLTKASRKKIHLLNTVDLWSLLPSQFYKPHSNPLGW